MFETASTGGAPRHGVAWRVPGIVTSIRDAGDATGTTRGRVVLPGDTHALAAVLLVLQNDTLLRHLSEQAHHDSRNGPHLSMLHGDW